MIPFEQVKHFYQTHLPNGAWKGFHLVAPCPFCIQNQREKQGQLTVLLNPDSFFRGMFKCQSGCVPGGFHFHFARLLGLDGRQVPGFDPDDDGFASDIAYPPRHLGSEIEKFISLMGQDQYDHFARYHVTQSTLDAMRVGFNGRYLVHPYTQETGSAYAARCVMPGKPQEAFWHGNELFFNGEAAVYNAPAIGHCEGGAMFITEGELSQLILHALGYPAIAFPSAADLSALNPERLKRIEHLFLLVSNTPESRQAARELAVRIGFKARILTWPEQFKRGDHLPQLAAGPLDVLKKTLQEMIRQSKAFSPFASPEKEHRQFITLLEKDKGKPLLGIQTGFAKFDRHTDGLRGINILGGPPKAGKSCFFMQVSTEVARRNVPVIYYDFENGRQKIYIRTLVRLSDVAEKKIRSGAFSEDEAARLKQATATFKTLLTHFRVVNDRRLSSDTMRRHIDFLQHETRKDEVLVVVDSLHKLPFKDLTERRTGIDSWLRQFESIRDDHQVCFLVISELSRGKGGGYGETPDLSSFKESGDIEYSADNALILMPDWDPMSPKVSEHRQINLWVVASREANPGRVATYELDYPFWRFKEL
jgi:replicative DNA helicase